MTNERATALSLFTGIGGFESGMHECGIDFVKALEWDGDCCATLSENTELLGHKEEIIEPIDIMKTAPEDFYDGTIDYIVGGPPCQSFSAAGRRAGGVAGTSDIRGTLFWYYCQYVNHFKPKAFVFENVRGILSSKKGADFKLICESFQKVGYVLHWRVLNAADYGVPQARERLFLVGIRDDLNIDFKFPRPTHGPDSLDKTPYVTTSKAIESLQDPNEVEVPYGGKWGHLLPGIPPGENYRFYTEEMGHPNPVFAWRSRFSGFLYKMDPDDVCRTIVSQQGRYDGPFHWKNRKCRISELKRLQGFPDDYVIPHDYTVAHKQIGNSVCPPVACQIGKAIRYQIEGLAEFAVPLLESNEKLSFDSRKGEKAKASRKKRVRTYDEIMEIELDGAYSMHEERYGVVIVRGQRTVWDFKDGVLNISLGADFAAEKLSLRLNIKLKGPVTKSIREISVTCSEDSYNSHSLALAWAAVHQAIEEYSSYESLMPLFGHFTEPYPKFEVEFECSDENSAVLFQKIALRHFASNDNIPFDQLNLNGVNPYDLVSHVREYGFDARSHETNSTIPEGYLRICYPFVLPGRHQFK